MRVEWKRRYATTTNPTETQGWNYVEKIRKHLIEFIQHFANTSIDKRETSDINKLEKMIEFLMLIFAPSSLCSGHRTVLT